MILNDVRTALTDAVKGVGDIHAYDFWPERISTPAVFLGWPAVGTYDSTYSRGMDEMTVPLLIVIGKVEARNAARQLSEYVDGGGPRSVKAAVESAPKTAWDVARVASWTSDVASVAGVRYLAVEFMINIYGKGA